MTIPLQAKAHPVPGSEFRVPGQNKRHTPPSQNREPTTQNVSLKGTIDRVFFASPTFSAGKLLTEKKDRVSFAGKLFAQPGEPVVLQGHWAQHPQYGQQFQVSGITLERDLSEEGLTRYLANHPAFKGIGPAKARKIAKRYGQDFEKTLLESPEDIATFAKVSLENVQTLKEHWEKSHLLNASLVTLSAYELTHKQVETLVARFGNNAPALLEKNPYLLLKAIKGYGFRRVDQIARKMGTPLDLPERLQAGIVAALSDRESQGDCWLEQEELLEEANKLLTLDRLDSLDILGGVLDRMLDKKDSPLTTFSYGGRFLIARTELHEKEKVLAKILHQRPNPHFTPSLSLREELHAFAPELNTRQLEAVAAAVTQGISLLCGGAGSGKTFTINVITRWYQDKGKTVLLTAPTGKAAKRMEQVVGLPAQTLHRLLGYDGKTFTRDAENPLEADLIILDEVSMVDVELAWQFFQAVDLRRTAIVMVGDHNQLPPVGPGNVLRDLVQHDFIPRVILDQVVRQAGVLKENSIAVLKGEVRPTWKPPVTSAATANSTTNHPTRGPWYVIANLTEPEAAQKYVLHLFENILEQQLNFDLIRGVQLLTPTHKGPLGTRELNIQLQRLVQKKKFGVIVPPVPGNRRPPFLVGDKVIQTKNNYTLGVMNGTVGTIQNVSPKALTIQFEDELVEVTKGPKGFSELELAYAFTIHRSQGSEYPCAVIICHKAHAFQHHRNLLYTAVTRAKETTILLGDRWGISNCAKKTQVDKRKTYLSLVPDMPYFQRS